MDAPEQRQHERHEVRCPISLCDDDGRELLTAHTANISDGGAFLSTADDGPPAVDGICQVRFALPRTTPNTRMLEDVSCEARVVRHQGPHEGRSGGVGIHFTRPLDLMIEV